MDEPTIPPDPPPPGANQAKPKKKGGRHQGDGVNAARYIQLVDLFRQQPGNVNRAAKTMGIMNGTARRAWFKGWPLKGWRPIKDVIDEEHRMARARMAELETQLNERRATVEKELTEKQVAGDTAYREKMLEAEAEARAKLSELLKASQMDAAKVMATEAQISRSAQGTSLSLYTFAQQLFGKGGLHLQNIASAINTALSGKTLTAKEASQILRDIARFSRDVQQVAKLALDIERERLGKPTEHIQVDVHDMTTDEALQELADSHALGELLREERASRSQMEPPQGPVADVIPLPTPTNGSGGVH